MTPSTKLSALVLRQAAEIPSMYGGVDFSVTPERFTVAPDDETELSAEFSARRLELLADEEQVARIKAYTLHGDLVADAYAALMPQYGFRHLAAMLDEACDRGVEQVPSAPPELVRFIREMERLPAWLDSELIAEGARIERNAYAHRAPFVFRGGLLATFMNKYSALPMALTGALSNKTAGRRAKETATFFTTTVMPGALERHGAGFKAAAKVRLMHSMVRFNVLRREQQWNFSTYGIPIPQVDQMPAGLVSIFLLAQRALRRGRSTFTRGERARAELARYRCFLLGLSEDLLPDTPQGIVDIMLTRHATLRKGFDETCSGLVRATMAADLTWDHSLSARRYARLERGFGKIYFLSNFMHGDRRAAARVGVEVGLADYLGAAAAAVLIATRMGAYALAAHLPVLRRAADRSLVHKLTRQLARYGHAEFVTNADTYRPAPSPPADPDAARVPAATPSEQQTPGRKPQGDEQIRFYGLL